MVGSTPADVYTASDIAQAAGVSDVRVKELLARGEIRAVAGFVQHQEAVRVVRALKLGSTVGTAGALGLGRELFAQAVGAERSTAMPLIVSTSLHGLAVATILFVASLGFASADVTALRALPNVHLVGPQPYETLPAWAKGATPLNTR